jgi:hypothetical protein
MAEATIGALTNLATATPADRGVVAALTQANARLTKQLEDNSAELWELRALLHKNDVRSVAKELLTHHKVITAGSMATKLEALARASPENSRNPAINRRPLEWITWEVVKQTENDVQG